MQFFIFHHINTCLPFPFYFDRLRKNGVVSGRHNVLNAAAQKHGPPKNLCGSAPQREKRIEMHASRRDAGCYCGFVPILSINGLDFNSFQADTSSNKKGRAMC